MKVIPLAAESLGVRSMATYVEVGRTGILIDPGATLAHVRFGLPPSEDEWEALRRANDRISAYAARSSFVFVSHYHEDHFRSDPASYVGRIVLAKDPRRMISGKQAQRGEALWKALEGQARVERADGARRPVQRVEEDHHVLATELREADLLETDRPEREVGRGVADVEDFVVTPNDSRGSGKRVGW